MALYGYLSVRCTEVVNPSPPSFPPLSQSLPTDTRIVVYAAGWFVVREQGVVWGVLGALLRSPRLKLLLLTEYCTYSQSHHTESRRAHKLATRAAVGNSGCHKASIMPYVALATPPFTTLRNLTIAHAQSASRRSRLSTVAAVTLLLARQMHFCNWLHAVSISFVLPSCSTDDPELYSHEYLAADIIAVLNAVGIDRTALLGHSVGGFSVARMAVEAPHRLTHAIFSSTFSGLVDDPPPHDAATPYVTQYVRNRQTDQSACERLAREVKAALPEGSSGASHASFGPDRGRFEHPDRPPSFSKAWWEAQPELTWLYEAQNDGNAQVSRLSLKSRFKILHARGAVPPAAFRAAFRGPVLFTLTDCDSLVHWELVYRVAQQIEALRLGPTAVHWLDGRLYHAPHWEDPEQFNRVLLAFLRATPALNTADGEGGAEPLKSAEELEPVGHRGGCSWGDHYLGF